MWAWSSVVVVCLDFGLDDGGGANDDESFSPFSADSAEAVDVVVAVAAFFFLLHPH